MSKGEADKPAKKSKLPLMIIAAVVIAGAAGGGAWFMAGKGGQDPHAAAESQRKAALRSRIFLPLDPFTVNLADTRETRMAQVAVVFEVENQGLADDIKAVMPRVRDRILTVVSSKQARELLSVEGKVQLTNQIADETTLLLGYQPLPRAVASPGEGAANAAPNAAAPNAAGPLAVASLSPTPVQQPQSRSGKPLIEVNLAQLIVQ